MPGPDERDEDIWAGAGPWARVTLPRGQALRVIVTGRRRTPDGWWYEVEALLWMRSQNPGGGWRPEQVPVTFDVPADRLEPIPGQDYGGVPTVDERIPRPWLLHVYTHPDEDGPRAMVRPVDPTRTNSVNDWLGEISAEILFDPPGHDRLPIEDDEIVDRAVAASALAAPNRFTLLTYDTGQATRGRLAGLNVKKLRVEPGDGPPGK